ncbi:MAG: 2-phosphosulfolactate phosphatase [Acidobacteriota bacterium]
MDPFSQNPYRCKLDWGWYGSRKAAERGDIIVIVDTLSFSTAVITAVHNGAIIYPCPLTDDPIKFALQVDAEAAVARKDVPSKGRFSLSPLTYLNLAPNIRIVLQSPNGAMCACSGKDVPYLFIGTLINAKAVAGAVSKILNGSDLAVTIIACGERWTHSNEDAGMRVAIEDYLAAGAILSYLVEEKSPEALICEGAFLQFQSRVSEMLWDCSSGQELREKGFAEDVRYSAQIDLYNSVPIMRREYIERLV